MSRVARDPFNAVAAAGVGISAVVVTVSVGTHYLAYRLQVAEPTSEPLAALKWFDVNSERNVPTAWAVLLLLASAGVAGMLSLRRDGRTSQGWLLVGATAGYLALDEGFELHERLGPAGEAIGGNLLHFAWVIPGAIAATVVGFVLLTRLRRQPLAIRRRLVFAGVVYLAGALVLETASGWVLRTAGAGETYVAVTAVEEFLELVGACLLLATLVAARSSARTETHAA